MKISKRFNLECLAILLGVICSCGIFSSCNDSEDSGGGVAPSTGKQLVLTINTPHIGTRASNLNVGTDDANENQINRLTVGIFSSDGNTVRTIQEFLKDGTNSFSTSGNKTTATVTTSSLSSGDKVLVAINAPAGEFAGVKSVKEFNGKTIDVNQALATSSDGTASTSEEATDNLPMYGEGSISETDSKYSASVSVQHQLAKITVTEVKVNFDPNGPYKNATFIPQVFFLINVPENMVFSNTAWTGTKNDLYQGWTGDASITTYPYLAYLNSGSILDLQGTPTVIYNFNRFFYTLPNSDTDQNTKLVIQGLFDDDGSEGTKQPVTVFYPININCVFSGAVISPGETGTTAKAVYPNRNYVCSIEIKTKGPLVPYTPIDPADVDIMVSVASFQSYDQDTIFN